MKDTRLATQKAAFEQLQTTLKSQEAQVQELKRQLAFFERIMRPTGEQVGVVIDNLTLQETSIPGRYHYRLALTQPAKKRELFRGQVQIRVEGSLADKPQTLTGRDLGMKGERVALCPALFPAAGRELAVAGRLCAGSDPCHHQQGWQATGARAAG